MPRQRRDTSSRSCLPCSPKPARIRDPLQDEVNVWKDARCPVCMEHPHNAILLMCSSHDKGCRPYMCDTSYRHSNCFDQFKNSSGDVSSVLQRPEPVDSDLDCERSPETRMPVLTAQDENAAKAKLACPLCRGVIAGCKVVNNARLFMNEKSRSCACETCDFNGTYTDLRKHARSMHPFVRPTEADPERERDWRRLERERDSGDVQSMIQSLFGGDETMGESYLLTVFFIVWLIRPGNENSSTRSRTARSRGQDAVGRRSSMRLWVEALDGNSDSRNGGGDVEDSESGLVSNVRRRTRSGYRNGGEDVEDSESGLVSNVRRRTRSEYRNGGEDVEDLESGLVSNVRRRTRSEYRNGGEDVEDLESGLVSNVRRRTRSEYRNGGDDVEDLESSLAGNMRRCMRSDNRDGGRDVEDSESSLVGNVRRRPRSDYRDGGGDVEDSERSWAIRRCRSRRSNPEENNIETSCSRDGFPGQQ